MKLKRKDVIQKFLEVNRMSAVCVQHLYTVRVTGESYLPQRSHRGSAEEVKAHISLFKLE